MGVRIRKSGIARRSLRRSCRERWTTRCIRVDAPRSAHGRRTGGRRRRGGGRGGDERRRRRRLSRIIIIIIGGIDILRRRYGRRRRRRRRRRGGGGGGRGRSTTPPPASGSIVTRRRRRRCGGGILPDVGAIAPTEAAVGGGEFPMRSPPRIGPELARAARGRRSPAAFRGSGPGRRSDAALLPSRAGRIVDGGTVDVEFAHGGEGDTHTRGGIACQPERYLHGDDARDDDAHQNAKFDRGGGSRDIGVFGIDG